MWLARKPHEMGSSGENTIQPEVRFLERDGRRPRKEVAFTQNLSHHLSACSADNAFEFGI